MDWSSLPAELLDLIIQRLPLPDQLRLPAVNKHWSAAVAGHRHPPSPSLPWVWLSPPLHSTRPGSGQFYNLEEKKVYILPMPSQALVGFCCGSYQEWLILTDDDITQLFFINPLSSSSIDHLPMSNIELPPPIVEYKMDYYPKVVLTSSPTDPDCLFFIIHPILGLYIGKDADWEGPGGGRTLNSCSDVILYNGSIYAANNDGELFLIDMSGASTTRDVVLESPLDSRVFRSYQGCWRLVELNGDLLMVYFVDDCHHFSMAERQVFKANLGLGKWEKVKNLGGHVLLVSQTGSRSMLGSHLPGFKTNCVYFLMDHCVHMLDVGKKKVEKNVDVSHGLYPCPRVFWTPRDQGCN